MNEDQRKQVYKILGGTAEVVSKADILMSINCILNSEQTSETLRILESLKEYCEDQCIWDKLGTYGNFYYKIIQILKSE